MNKLEWNIFRQNSILEEYRLEKGETMSKHRQYYSQVESFDRKLGININTKIANTRKEQTSFSFALT